MNVVLKSSKEKIKLTDKEYFRIVNECNSSLSLTRDENNLLLNSSVPRFIANIPYLSGESNPDILACMNLTTYIAGTRNKGFYQSRDNETIAERIEPYIHSVNGNSETIKLCKLILEEVSLLDHRNDLKEDIKSGKSNPIASGIIDFHKEKEKIESARKSYPLEIQEIVDSSFKGEVLASFWTYPVIQD